MTGANSETFTGKTPESFAAVIVAGGRSRRMGFNKLFAPLAGRPVFLHSLQCWQKFPELKHLVVVVPSGEIAEFARRSADLPCGLEIHWVEGGQERADSVRAGVAAVPKEIGWVAVHDAARPLVSADMIVGCLAVAQRIGAAVCAEPCHDTLHRTDTEGILRETISRDGLWRMQTPQIFRRARLLELLQAAQTRAETHTDEAGLALRAGDPVGVFAVEAPNLKITLPQDLVLAEAILKLQKAPQE